MILTVGKRLIGRSSKSLRDLLWRTKHRHVLQFFFSKDELTVQSFSNVQRQNFFEDHVESKKDIVIADNANDVKYYTENRIRIDEERVGFTAR